MRAPAARILSLPWLSGDGQLEADGVVGLRHLREVADERIGVLQLTPAGGDAGDCCTVAGTGVAERDSRGDVRGAGDLYGVCIHELDRLDRQARRAHANLEA